MGFLVHDFVYTIVIPIVQYDWVRFSDDEEDEDARLCNMAMLCGPPGVGKTSAVYG